MTRVRLSLVVFVVGGSWVAQSLAIALSLVLLGYAIVLLVVLAAVPPVVVGILVEPWHPALARRCYGWAGIYFIRTRILGIFGSLVLGPLFFAGLVGWFLDRLPPCDLEEQVSRHRRVLRALNVWSWIPGPMMRDVGELLEDYMEVATIMNATTSERVTHLESLANRSELAAALMSDAVGDSRGGHDGFERSFPELRDESKRDAHDSSLLLLMRAIHELGSGESRVALATTDELIASCHALPRRWRRAGDDLLREIWYLRGAALVEMGRNAEAIPDLQEGLREARRSGDDLSAIACFRGLAKALSAEGMHDQALVRLREARRLAERNDLQLQRAGVDVDIARTVRDSGALADALPIALGALQGVDAIRYRMRHSGYRQQWVRQHLESYDLALGLAHTAADDAIVAELIEAARIQGVPRGAGAGPPAANDEPREPQLDPEPLLVRRSAKQAAVGLAPLTPPPELRLFDRSEPKVATLAPATERTGRVSLEQAARRVAGPKWWWWGSWATEAFLYWSVLNHEGAVWTGAISLKHVQLSLDRLQSALPIPLLGETPVMAKTRALSGQLADFDEESTLSQALARVLMPDPLRAALRRRASEDPLSLVVAPAPELGRVPFHLLSLDGERVRLGERAIIRHGASIALLTAARQSPRKPGPPAVLHVIDAEETRGQRDEPLLRSLPRYLKTRLDGDAILTRKGHVPTAERWGYQDPEASRDALGARFRQLEFGVLAFLGHAARGPTDAPADSVLLIGDSTFSARTWLYDPEGWPAPPAVALVACASSGADSPEWLGFGPAALWAGAGVVICTAWDLVRHDSTPLLAQEVIAILRSGEDAAVAWHDHFVEHLRRWRSLATDPAEGPLSWGAVNVLGYELSSKDGSS